MPKPNVSTEGTGSDFTQGASTAEVKKEKKKYSSTYAQSLQELESGLTKGARRIAKAVQEGLDEYAERNEESASRKRDGALRDLLRNHSKALRKALPIAAKAPADVLDAVADLKPVRRLFRT
jgi:hypothetical protein